MKNRNVVNKSKCILFGIVMVTLGGCGTVDNYAAKETTPGSPLPKIPYICKKWDGISRCSEWSNPSDQCVNPKGINEPDPVVLCSSIKRNKS